MKKVGYVVTAVALFAVLGALYVHDRLAGVRMRRRLVAYTGDPWADQEDQ